MTIYEYEGEMKDDTIWEDMEEKEQIVLSDYNTKEEMHALMVEKGFELKSPEEIEAMKLQKQKEAAEEAEQKAKRREETRIRREESQKKREQDQKKQSEEEEESKKVEEEAREEVEKMEEENYEKMKKEEL